MSTISFVKTTTSARDNREIKAPLDPTSDIERFQRAFETHYDALLAYALRRARTREDAEEVVASTFTTAWRRIDSLPPEPVALTWLYRVAWKTLANQHRGNARRVNLFSRLSGLRDQNDDLTRPDRVAEGSGAVEIALARLRSKDQEVLRLVAWEELSYVEAAEVLGCSPNAFAVRLHRAKAALKTELEKLGDEGDAEDQQPPPTARNDDD